MKKFLLAFALIAAVCAPLQAVPLWMNMGSGNAIVADHITVSNTGMGAQEGGAPGYVSFVLTPDSGFQIDFTNFSFEHAADSDSENQ